MNGCEAAGDLALIQPLLLLSCKLGCCNANLSILTLQKHEGLYQIRVTGSLASILRPGNLATTVKWSIEIWLFERSPFVRANVDDSLSRRAYAGNVCRFILRPW